MYIARFDSVKISIVLKSDVHIYRGSFVFREKYLDNVLVLLFVAHCNYGAISLQLSSWICRDTRL